ncbi:MAG TPA: hypothetical protein PKN66_09880, partial [Thermodesulfovibrio thiophilus]|nr:hypothetical protein [Thermodesulfovibrio thiophilus]
DQALNLARSAASQQQAWERSIQKQQLAIQRAAGGRKEGTTTDGLNISGSFDDEMIKYMTIPDKYGKIMTPQEAAQQAFAKAQDMGLKLSPADFQLFVDRANQLKQGIIQKGRAKASTVTTTGGIPAQYLKPEYQKYTTESFFNRLYSSF